jgi:hypothetical protein
MKLRNTFISLGYKVCNADLGVFYRFSGTKYTIVAVATDDLTIIAESVESAQLIKTQLNEHFELVDLGEIKWLLGVHITRDYENRTILLGQQTYIDDIVKRFGLEDARPLLTPMEPGADLTPGAPHVSPIKLTARERSSYREMIGALLYCSSVTELMSPTSYRHYLAISKNQPKLITPLFYDQSDTSKGLETTDSFLEAKTQNCEPIPTPTGLLKVTVILFQDLPSSTAVELSHGARRSNRLSHYRVPNLSMLLSHTS